LASGGDGPGIHESPRKAVVLARGLGTRMQRHRPGVELSGEAEWAAGKGLKALMPVGGRPFLDYVADGLLRAGLTEICLVVAPEADATREHARRIGRVSGARVECAVQQEPLGTADAALAAEGFVGDDAFILCNGDNLYPQEALSRLAGLPGEGCWLAAFDRDELIRHGNIAPARVRDFAVVTVEGPDDALEKIVEKPADPEQYRYNGTVWVSMNLYRFTPAVFAACRRVEPDPGRGELELTAAVAELAASGGQAFRVLFCGGGVLDLTSRADVPAVAEALEGRPLSF
jgi:glucose-1-phosphate thymidylyltransferase